MPGILPQSKAIKKAAPSNAQAYSMMRQKKGLNNEELKQENGKINVLKKS